MDMNSKLKLLYLVLCDGFGTEPNTGKKNFLGVFDRIVVDKWPNPSVFPSLTITVGLEGGQGPFNIGITLRDPNEKEIFQSPVFPITPKDPYRREDILVQINGLQLEHLGRYEVRVSIGGESLWSYPLYVEEKASQKQIAGQGV